ncbi:MAG: hypothetical protein QT09_C0004G0080 [archaeon GW2011_AR18]|nr:MAG: hypothetical protein QT09_C0004G0080 [archaeon GW2011_AR18]
MIDTNTLVLYVILGAVLGIVWSLRKIYTLERNIAVLDIKIERLLEHKYKRKK